MPRKRLSIRKVHEVLRLKWEGKLSYQAIAQSCYVSHNIVTEYVHQMQVAGPNWPLSEEIDEDQLRPPAKRVVYCFGRPALNTLKR
jgi:hypothetical protein